MVPSAFLSAAVLLAAGLAAGAAIGLSMRSTSVRTVTATTVVVVNGSRSAGSPPAAIPNFLEGTKDPHELTLADAVPSDATLISANFITQGPKQLIVTWDRAHLGHNRQGAVWQRRGMAIWQLDPGSAATTWHRVFTFERPITNSPVTVDRFAVSTGDVSGDGRPEILVFFDMGGSAGSGTYHLFVNDGPQLRQPLIKKLSLDEGTISFTRGALRIDQGADGYSQSPHCCFRKARVTLLRWNGNALATVRQTVGPNRRGWPPGA
jgi:hypothetical protein